MDSPRSYVQQFLEHICVEGHVAKLNLGEARALLVLIAHADSSDGRVSVSNKDLARETGSYLSNLACKSVRDLEAAGLVVSESQGGGRGNLAVRRLVAPPQVSRPALSATTGSYSLIAKAIENIPKPGDVNRAFSKIVSDLM